MADSAADDDGAALVAEDVAAVGSVSGVAAQPAIRAATPTAARVVRTRERPRRFTPGSGDDMSGPPLDTRRTAPSCGDPGRGHGRHAQRGLGPGGRRPHTPPWSRLPQPAAQV